MIYEHRTYTILPGKMEEYVETFGKIIVPLFEKHGAKLVGVWQTEIGQSNEFVYILGFQDLNDRDRFFKSIRQDEEFNKYRQSGLRVAYTTSKIIKPTSYSPLN